MRRLVNLQPSRASQLVLSLLPFVLLALVYLMASDARLQENPNDKMLPGIGSFVEAVKHYAFEADKRSGQILLWSDTWASVTRLFQGLTASAIIGLVAGIALGIIPFIGATFGPFVAALSLIPPLAVLPILFIVFGLGEASKVVLITVGIAPFIVRDVAMRIHELPREQLIKAQTLGASSWTLVLRVVLPQIMPRLVDALRLSLGAAWLFLIAAEAIAAEDGLGYRIFLVRRYLAMDVILPYVVWITLLAYTMDYVLARLSRLLFPWYQTGTNRR